MKPNQLLPSTLEEKMHQKIAALKALENDIPAVIIVHDLRKNASVVHMSQRGLKELGMSLAALQAMSVEEYHSRFFNPDDARDYVPKILGLLERNCNEESVSFFQQVRLSEKHDWQWHLSSTKIFMWDEYGKPWLTLTVSIPIDPKHHFTAKVERLLQENNFLRSNQHIFAQLSKREKEILRLMALGLSSGEIAEKLHISETTAATHRRNIRNKLNAQTNYDITRFAQAFDLI